MESYAAKLTGSQTTVKKITNPETKRFTGINAHMFPDGNTKAYDTIGRRGKGLGHVFASLPRSHPANILHQWESWSPLNTKVHSVEVKKETPSTLVVNYVDPKQTPSEYPLEFVVGALLVVTDIYNKQLVVVVWHEDDVHFSIVSLLGEVLHTNKKLPTIDPGYIWTAADYCTDKMVEQIESSPKKPLKATLAFTVYKKCTDTEAYSYKAYCILD